MCPKEADLSEKTYGIDSSLKYRVTHGHLIIVYSLVRGKLLLLAILVNQAVTYRISSPSTRLWLLIISPGTAKRKHDPWHEKKSRFCTCSWVARFFWAFKTRQTSHKICFASLFVLRLHEALLWWVLLTDPAFCSLDVLLASPPSPSAEATFAFGKTYCASSCQVSKMMHGSSLTAWSLH